MTQAVTSLSPEHLAGLVQLAGELTSEVRLPALLDRILTEAARLTESAGGSLMLYDDRQRRLYVAHAIGPDAETVRAKWGAGGEGIPIVGSKAGGVFTSGVPIVVNDLDRDPEHFKAVDRETRAPTRTMICVPLVVSDIRVGAVQLINRERGEYSAYDQALLLRFAELSAVAVRNAQWIRTLAMHMGAYVDPHAELDATSIQQLLAAPPAAERMSVMFADLRGFTQLSHTLAQPELLLSRLNAFLTELADAVGRHGGVVNKFLGDGVLALFRGSEYEARAVGCAADMVRRFDRLRQAWDDETNEPLDFLDIGIGIATDAVMIGTVGNEHVREFTVVGRAVGVAAGLMGLARGGRRILCDRMTFRAAAPMIAEFAGPERVTLKKPGQESGPVYEVYEIRSLEDDAAPSPAGTRAGVPPPPAPPQPPPTIFVSYSHADAEWLAQLRVHLAPFLRQGHFEVWDDSRIAAGARWRAEIETALAHARAAVLLVSPHFLSSDFIHGEELLPIIESARRRGLRIFWIPLSASAFDQTEVANFQAAHDPRRPLEQLSPAERNAAWVDICRQISSAFGR